MHAQQRRPLADVIVKLAGDSGLSSSCASIVSDSRGKGRFGQFPLGDVDGRADVADKRPVRVYRGTPAVTTQRYSPSWRRSRCSI